MSTPRGELIWTPDADAWERSNIAAFAATKDLHDHGSLLEWSVSEPDDFWMSFADWADVRWHRRPTCALADATMPGRWFPGGTLNYAEHALRHDAAAVVSLSQTRGRRHLDSTELRAAVARCRAGLVRLGVRTGDRVAAFLPNIDETLVAFLATASLGAIWSSCAPEFGVRAVVDRFSQLEPTILLAIDGYRYGTRGIDKRSDLAEIVAQLPSLRHLVMLPYLHDPTDSEEISIPMSTWDELCSVEELLTFEPVAADHPLYVLFSSGTTGLPKPIVHGHGGIVVEHLKALALHHDIRHHDRFMWFSTTGWMMWNYLISGLLLGSTVVLFDGDPGWPDIGALWRIAAMEQVTVLGVSAPFIMACLKDGLRPGTELGLARLRQVGSTGAPLPAAGFRWIRDAVGDHVQPVSISGGTDVCTAFVGASPTLPVRAGEIAGRMLACDVRAVGADGAPCPPGVTGELVIGTPMPSMPVGFWGDESGERYRAAYFDWQPGLWHHGDWITFFDDGACQITGRSDATLNRGGVRLGTSDFYSVVEGMPEIADAVVVHLEDAQGGPGELILLVACTVGHHLDDALRARIGRELRSQLSPRHVPDTIVEAGVLPRTLSRKRLEVPIKRLLLGADPATVASRDSLTDARAFDEIVAWCHARALAS